MIYIRLNKDITEILHLQTHLMASSFIKHLDFYFLLYGKRHILCISEVYDTPSWHIIFFIQWMNVCKALKRKLWPSSSMWLSQESYSSAANIAKPEVISSCCCYFNTETPLQSKSSFTLWNALCDSVSNTSEILHMAPALTLSWSHPRLDGPSAICTGQTANEILIICPLNEKPPAGICQSPVINLIMCSDTDCLAKIAEH